MHGSGQPLFGMTPMGRPPCWTFCCGTTCTTTCTTRLRSWYPSPCSLSKPTTMSGQGTSTTQVSGGPNPHVRRCLRLSCCKLSKILVHLVHKRQIWHSGLQGGLDGAILLIHSPLLHTQGGSKPSSWSTQRPGEQWPMPFARPLSTQLSASNRLWAAILTPLPLTHLITLVLFPCVRVREGFLHLHYPKGCSRRLRVYNITQHVKQMLPAPLLVYVQSILLGGQV